MACCGPGTTWITTSIVRVTRSGSVVSVQGEVDPTTSATARVRAVGSSATMDPPHFYGGSRQLMKPRSLFIVPTRSALAVCSTMRPPVDISVGGDSSNVGVGAGAARTEFRSTAAKV